MRSFMAAFSSGVIRAVGMKRVYNHEKTCSLYMSYCARMSAKPYKIPSGVRMHAQTDYYRFCDTDIIYLQAKDRKPKQYILYLHGGAYMEQPVVFQWNFIKKVIHETNVAVIAPIYNKTPRHTYEQAYTMLYALYRELLKHTAPENIIFLGDSAGGGLALAFAQDLLKADLPQPQQLILLSPWLDISMSNDDMDALDKVDPNLGKKGLITVAKAWAGNTDLHDPKLSPLFGSNVGLAKTALFVGTREMLLPDCRIYREKALADGVDFTYVEQEGGNHCYPFYPTPEAKKAKKQIINLINTGRI